MGNGIESFNTDDLIMSATSYYLGRQTISVDAHCQCLVRAWPQLSQGVREYVENIVEATFDQEANMQRIGRDWSPFGDACDRESWCKVRECWKRHAAGTPERMAACDTVPDGKCQGCPDCCGIR